MVTSFNLTNTVIRGKTRAVNDQKIRSIIPKRWRELYNLLSQKQVKLIWFSLKLNRHPLFLGHADLLERRGQSGSVRFMLSKPTTGSMTPMTTSLHFTKYRGTREKLSSVHMSYDLP